MKPGTDAERWTAVDQMDSSYYRIVQTAMIIMESFLSTDNLISAMETLTILLWSPATTAIAYVTMDPIFKQKNKKNKSGPTRISILITVMSSVQMINPWNLCEIERKS
jgi:hypothetical protein